MHWEIGSCVYEKSKQNSSFYSVSYAKFKSITEVADIENIDDILLRATQIYTQNNI